MMSNYKPPDFKKVGRFLGRDKPPPDGAGTPLCSLPVMQPGAVRAFKRRSRLLRQLRILRLKIRLALMWRRINRAKRGAPNG